MLFAGLSAWHGVKSILSSHDKAEHNSDPPAVSYTIMLVRQPPDLMDEFP
jgi:hypothetical protein